MLRQWQPSYDQSGQTTSRFRFRPRIDKEVEMFRHLTRRDLVENENFREDVKECLENIIAVPSIRYKMKETFKEMHNYLRSFHEQRSAKSASAARQRVVSRRTEREE